MNIQLINTGRELMLGRVLNTHQQWLCRQLANRGYTVTRQVAVDDSGPAIQGALRECLEAADLILTTGGLGPTSDDRTRDLIADLLQRPLHTDPSVVAHIESFFAARHKPCPDRVRVQAQVPEGARVLPNANGTAPGLVMDCGPAGRPQSALLVMLPGPPRELRPMFSNLALPQIEARFPRDVPFAFRVLRTTGLGESHVEEQVSGALAALAEAGLDPGYCARPGEVDIQLVARGPCALQAVVQAEAAVRSLLGPYIFGHDEETLEEVVVRELTVRARTVALAESCTGGYIANRLTNIPGASAVLRAGWVTYSNAAKETCLDVPAGILQEHGAVSGAVACAMARGARIHAQSDFALAVTGIAGPDGGSAEKPVGTVHIALAHAQGETAACFHNPYDRETFKYVTSQQALEWLRRTVLADR